MTNVLVAYGSKMGGTAGLAEGLAAELSDQDLTVDLRPAAVVGDVGRYDAFVVGSAVYANRWRREVLRLLRRIADNGDGSPVWLFQSGPLGERAPESQSPLAAIAWTYDELNIKGAMTFGGRLPEKPKGLVARSMARTGAGDWRNFEDVARFADRIAGVLRKARVGVDRHR